MTAPFCHPRKSLAGIHLRREIKTPDPFIEVVSGEQLWEEFKSLLNAQGMTDYWEQYEKFVPPEKYIQSKGKILPDECYNSLFRYFLACSRWKKQCYRKSETM